MARTENEKQRDLEQTNLLEAVYNELQKLNNAFAEYVKGKKNAKWSVTR